MGNIYVISDLHFCHENLAKHRGFIDSKQHDEFIIDSWNAVVTKGDTVWLLGDITMEKSKGYGLLDSLKGYKKVVLGNHDKPQHVKELLEHVNLVCGSFKYKDLILTHFPIHPQEFRKFRINAHGHVHQNTIPDDDRYVNVSAEAINYTPILLNNL